LRVDQWHNRTWLVSGSFWLIGRASTRPLHRI
jgi:hypothetical protein